MSIEQASMAAPEVHRKTDDMTPSETRRHLPIPYPHSLPLFQNPNLERSTVPKPQMARPILIRASILRSLLLVSIEDPLRRPSNPSPGSLVVNSCSGSAGARSTDLRALRFYANEGSDYDLFKGGRPGDTEFRKAWKKEMDRDDHLWTGSDEDDVDDKDDALQKEIRKVKKEAEENSNRVDADDSDELRSIWSDSDEEMTLWTGSECDDESDIPTEAHPNERSDQYIDKIFEFEEKPKYRTIAELLKDEEEPKEMSPGKQARKVAVENALKRLKRGPDGRYINVWEVMSDIDILIGAFENIVSGPEYADLREGGPKKLNMQFFKDIQARMRDPNYKFSPELKLKPKSKLVSRKKWQRAQSKRRKDARR